MALAQASRAAAKTGSSASVVHATAASTSQLWPWRSSWKPGRSWKWSATKARRRERVKAMLDYTGEGPVPSSERRAWR